MYNQIKKEPEILPRLNRMVIAECNLFNENMSEEDLMKQWHHKWALNYTYVPVINIKNERVEKLLKEAMKVKKK